MNENLKQQLGIDENKPVDWFENLYSGSNKGGDGVPWANMKTHPVFKNWLTEHPNALSGKSALVVGCGMGDDAIELESLGFEVTAFDVSSSAIELCKKRFPKSKVNFVQADLLKDIPQWHQQFDVVLEIFTIQALPPKYESTIIKNITNFVSDQGQLVVITEVQGDKRTFEKGPPWVLNHDYATSIAACGLLQTYNWKSDKAERGEEIHLSIFKRPISI